MSRTRRKAKAAVPRGPEAPQPESRTARGRGDRESPAATAPPAAAARAGLLIAAGLAVIVAARAALAFAPGMWAWSLNLHRFLAPVWAWAPWALLALALIPAVARRVEPALERSGDWIARHSGLAGFLSAALAATLALAFPDQVRFTGDFLIRQGTVEVGVVPERVWPQAMPLDALLHYSLPLWLTQIGAADANGAARAIGALEAAMLGALAVAFVSTLRLRGAAVWAGSGIVFGGFLGLFTGYGKAFTEMTVLGAAIGVAGLRVIREGRGLLVMNVAFALALAIHRSSLAFVPGVLLAWVLWARRFGAWRSWETRLALAAPVLALALLLPRIVRIVATVDPVHFASAEVAARGGLVASALEAVRLTDAANVMMLLAPLAWMVPLALLGLGRGLPRGREALFLAVLAAPFVLSIPFVHALGGLFRDIDDFAVAGITVALLAAWLAGETLRAQRRPRRLALPLLLAVVVPALQWMAHQTDLERGIRRVEAFLGEPPPRTAAEQARTWDFVGSRWNQLERFEASAEAYRRATLTGPSPRMLHQWAIAEELRGNLRGSLDVFRRLVAMDPANKSAWEGYAQVAGKLQDRGEVRRAVTRLLELDPADAQAQRILRALDAEASQRP